MFLKDGNLHHPSSVQITRIRGSLGKEREKSQEKERV